MDLHEAEGFVLIAVVRVHIASGFLHDDRHRECLEELKSCPRDVVISLHITSKLMLRPV